MIAQLAFLGREETREFPVMRRQNDAAAKPLYGCRKLHRIAGKARQGVGIEDDCTGLRLAPAAPKRPLDHRRGRSADSHARAHDDGILAPVREQFREPGRTIADARHDRGQCRCMHAQRFLRRGDGDETGPCPQRTARREPRRAGRDERAGKNQCMAASIFMTFEARARQHIGPDRRPVDESLRRNRVRAPIPEMPISTKLISPQ